MRAFLCLVMCAVCAPAQQSVHSAALSGRCEDSSGAAVAAVRIELRDLDHNRVVSAVAGAEGLFRFPSLAAARYELRATKAGFQPQSRGLELHAGQALDISLPLAVDGGVVTIDVTSEVPLVEAVRTQVAETVTTREIDGLPLNGRNYLDLALLAPSVSRTNTGGAQRFAETSAVPGTGLSIGGQRNLNNGFLLDGFSLNDDAADLAGAFFSQEVIREFQVITAGGIAEFGRASSGFVSVVSRSGSNDWHGRFYGFLRNQRLDARNTLAARKDPLTQAQYGATAGGPFRRDRLFLFSNFEQTRQNAAGFVTIAAPGVEAINQTLARVLYRGARVETGEYPTGLESSNFFARADAHIGRSGKLAARYSFYEVASWNARTVGGLSAISRGSGLRNRDHSAALAYESALSPAALNELRFQFTRSRLAAPANDAFGPAVNISGVASFGTATSSPTARDNDLYELANNLSFIRGAHSWKAGAMLLHNRLNIVFPGAVEGVYTFGSLAAFRDGRYINFQQAFGRASQRQSNPNFGAFLQDEWRPHRSLTANWGVRYDVQGIDDPVRAGRNNFAPRLGLAFSPADRKTVVRAGFGLYFDRIPLRAVSNALQRDGLNYRVALLSFGQDSAPAFPHTLAAFPAGVLSNVTAIDPGIAASYTHQSTLQIERQIGRASSISAGYQHLRGLHLILARNVNVPALSAAQAASLGAPNLGRPDPRYGNVSRYESSGDSYYDGLTLSYHLRAARRASLRLSYTLSKVIDNAGNFFFSTPQNNFNLRDDRGLSDNDQRHRVTVSGSYAAPRRMGGFELSGVFSYASALPFNIQTGADRNNDTNVNDRPIGIGRNTGRGFGFQALDLRLARRFRIAERVSLDALAEAFNTLNHTNWRAPNNIVGPNLGRATGASDPRQVQFGLRLSY